jgi:hypothetical protein
VAFSAWLSNDDLEGRLGLAQEKRHAKSSRLWGQPFTIANILDTLEATLTSPASEQTQAKLQEKGSGPAR